MAEENVLDNEVIDSEIEDIDLEDDIDVYDEDGDVEFEYDENGDIVVPDEEFDSEIATESPDEETPAEKAAPAPDPRDEEIVGLRARLRALERQAKDTLETIGVKSEDAMSGLVKVAAEIKGQSEAEYNADKAKKENDELARNMLKNQLFEAKAMADLKELHAAYPETRQYKHLRDMPREILQIFGAQRDAGFSVKQAYAAANPDGIRKDVATSVKKQAQHDTKAHLKSAVPKSSKSDGVSMSKAELISWREMFPGMSDAEIKKIYKQSQ